MILLLFTENPAVPFGQYVWLRLHGVKYVYINSLSLHWKKSLNKYQHCCQLFIHAPSFRLSSRSYFSSSEIEVATFHPRTKYLLVVFFPFFPSVISPLVLRSTVDYVLFILFLSAFTSINDNSGNRKMLTIM